MNYVEFKELWEQSEYGVWYFGGLHGLVLKQEDAIDEIRRQHMIELQELERA